MGHAQRLGWRGSLSQAGLALPGEAPPGPAPEGAGRTGRCKAAGVRGQAGWGWGRPGLGSGPTAVCPVSERACARGGSWRHSPTLGTGAAAAGALPFRGVPSLGPRSTPALQQRQVVTAARQPRRGGGACNLRQAYRPDSSSSCRGRAGWLAHAQKATPAGTPPTQVAQPPLAPAQCTARRPRPAGGA